MIYCNVPQSLMSIDCFHQHSDRQIWNLQSVYEQFMKLNYASSSDLFYQRDGARERSEVSCFLPLTFSLYRKIKWWATVRFKSTNQPSPRSRTLQRKNTGPRNRKAWVHSLGLPFELCRSHIIIFPCLNRNFSNDLQVSLQSLTLCYFPSSSYLLVTAMWLTS